MQVGYSIGDIGEYGKPADLRRDATGLAAELQNIVCKYGDHVLLSQLLQPVNSTG